MTSYSYQHSQTFAQLKSITESIGSNLSSYQYLAILDSLLLRALYPIVDNTSFVDNFLAKILAWQYLNPRRKASSIPKTDLASYVTFFLIAGQTEHKIRYLQKTKLDRGILAEIVRVWLKVVEPYEDLVTSPDELDVSVDYAERETAIELLASLKADHSLYGAYQQTKYWWAQYQSFRNMVLEKYTRMCLSKAQQDYEELGRRVPLDDMVQIYLFTAARAIDKCDTDKGVLTTYIKNWLKDAKNKVMTSHMADVAYSLPKNSKTAGKNMAAAQSISLDDVDLDAEELLNEANEERQHTLDEVRLVAKMFDPVGFGRLALGIQEYLSTDDRKAIRAASVPARARYRHGEDEEPQSTKL